MHEPTIIPTTIPTIVFTTRERRRLARRVLLYRTIAPALCRPVAVSTKPALVIAPHQDDETFGCGGIIAAKRAAGVPVSVVFVTDGSRCNGDTLSAIERSTLVALREAEASAALARLGVLPESIHFLRLPDGTLASLDRGAHGKFRGRLQDFIISEPNIEVYTPHRRDSHPDHEACTAVVKEAARAAGGTTVWEYPVWLFWSRNRFLANLFPGDFRGGVKVDVRPFLEAKRAAIAEYTSQLATLPPGFVDQFLWGEECFYRIEGR